MKLTIDLSNPQDVKDALALLQAGPASSPAPAAPKAPAAPAAPAAPTPPAAPAPAAPAPQAPAPAAPTPPAPPPPAGGDPAAAASLSAAVNAFAKAYGAKQAKARFGEASVAFGANPAWTKTSDIPADKIADVLPWFAVAAS